MAYVDALCPTELQLKTPRVQVPPKKTNILAQSLYCNYHYRNPKSIGLVGTWTLGEASLAKVTTCNAAISACEKCERWAHALSMLGSRKSLHCYTGWGCQFLPRENPTAQVQNNQGNYKPPPPNLILNGGLYRK